MSDKNPVKAIDAILESPIQTSSLTVMPLTIGRYALLELVNSPFLFGGEFTVSNMLPSVYIMSVPFKNLIGYTSQNIDDLKSKSYEWADTLEITDFDKVIAAIVDKVKALNSVAPSGSEDDDGKKKLANEKAMAS